jgi:RNA recognition motif-containing protein
MRAYFSQFGEVLRLRLSRNKLTGKSKHYAFIEFAHPEVADIVSETHNNMLMCDRLIKCSVVPCEKVILSFLFSLLLAVISVLSMRNLRTYLTLLTTGAPNDVDWQRRSVQGSTN